MEYVDDWSEMRNTDEADLAEIYAEYGYEAPSTTTLALSA